MTGHSDLNSQVTDKLRQVVDPCMEAAGLGLSIVDLGLVRAITIDEADINVELGLTEPGCGFTHALVTRVDDVLVEFREMGFAVNVTFNWREPWTESRMSEDGRAVFTTARQRGVSVLQRYVPSTDQDHG